MEIEYHKNVNEFLRLCTPFLIRYETENNLLFGILNNLRKDIHHYSKEETPELILITEEEEIVLVTIRTPPFNQLLSYTKNLETIDFLVDELIKKETTLPGVFGFNEGALRFCQLWAERRNIKYELSMHERIYRLTKVNPKTKGQNVFDHATMSEKDLILSWIQGFIRDCFPDRPEEAVAETAEGVEKAIKGRKFYLLKVDEKPVSMVKSSGITPNGQAINAVYTPPPERRKGYATEVVSKISQKILDEGKKYCFLFTDLANPTSNKIYQEIGYKPIIDVDQYRFETP
ncbi:MAG: GNAT family N-acetyltransferase [Candidatus Hodarchaeales archaeon]